MGELDDDVSESMGTFMAFYIIAGNFVLMNMIMTVFVERLTKSIREDKDTDAAEAFAKLFSTEGGEKEVTWEDFARNLEEPAMQDYFQSMDLHVNAAEARALFDLIDVDDSGTLSNDEIVNGCLSFKGPARALEQFLIMRDVSQIGDILSELRAMATVLTTLRARVDDVARQQEQHLQTDEDFEQFESVEKAEKKQEGRGVSVDFKEGEHPSASGGLLAKKRRASKEGCG